MAAAEILKRVGLGNDPEVVLESKDLPDSYAVNCL